MIGIVSYGTYVPYYRLSLSDISNMWNSPAKMGERSVANFDEDSITMSVAASMDCLSGIDPKRIDALHFASTTAPYLEKMSASVVAAALDFRAHIFASDFSGTLRAGTNALRSAVGLISGGLAERVMVCAADARMGFPGSANEKLFGDGAAALLLGKDDVIASVEGCYSCCNEILDVWRSDKDRFVRTWEGRFVRDAGYARIVPGAVAAALKKYNLKPGDFSKVVFSAPSESLASLAAKKSGFDPKAKMQECLDNIVGDTGAALPIMLLASALEEAQEGDRLLLVSYGDGCDVLILRVTANIKHFLKRNGLKRYILNKKTTSYDKYLRWRELLPFDPPTRPPADQTRPAAPALWRDNKGGLALYGVRCKACNTPQYPAQRVCYKCKAKDNFEDYRFTNRKAKLTTYSHDMLSASLDPPITVCAVDFIDGGRIMCDMTDRDPQEITVDMPVEMTFRRLFYGAHFYTYWWKCRPIRLKECKGL